MKITDLKCAILGENPVIRIVTDEGVDGYGQIESTKPYTTPHVLFFRDALLGWRALRKNPSLVKTGFAALVVVALLAVPVFLTGEPAEEAVENVAGVSEATIHPHEEAAEAALIVTGIAGAMALVALGAYRRRALPRWLTGGAFTAALVATTMLGWAANLGGQIRHTEIGGAAAASSGEEVEDHKR